MSAHSSSQEVLLSAHDLIITKTNTKGLITYANRMFMEVSNYPEERLLGEAHNIVRHPDMPRGVFRLMWKTLSQGHEFFGVIKNYTACHNFYWVFANITPDYAKNRQIQGYYSVRRQASRAEIATMSEIYQKMRAIEQQHGKQQGPDAAMNWLLNHVRQQGYASYESFVLSLHRAHQGTKQR